MKMLFIKRLSPSYGQVYMKTFDDREQLVTKIIPYEDCMAYVRAHQKELAVFKIGYKSLKENAKRKQLGRILAENSFVALKLFRGQISGQAEPGVYSLHRGNWDEIYSITKEGN